MATFGEMQQNVSKWSQDPNNTAVALSDVQYAINRAIRFWKKRRFWFNEKTETVVLTQSNNFIPLPDDFMIPSLDDGAFVIEYSGIRYPLVKLSEAVYNAYYLTNGVGQPFWYSKQASPDNYVVYPIPDKNYILRCFYLKEYAQLSADSDENDWTEEAQDLIEYQATAYIARDFRQDLEMHASFKQSTQEEYQNLLLRTRKENATGSLTLNSTLI